MAISLEKTFQILEKNTKFPFRLSNAFNKTDKLIDDNTPDPNAIPPMGISDQDLGTALAGSSLSRDMMQQTLGTESPSLLPAEDIDLLINQVTESTQALRGRDVAKDIANAALGERGMRIASEKIAGLGRRFSAAKNVAEMMLTPVADVAMRPQQALFQYIMNVKDGTFNPFDRSVMHRISPEMFRPVDQEDAMWLNIDTPAVSSILHTMDVFGDGWAAAIDPDKSGSDIIADALQKNPDAWEKLDPLLSGDVIRHVMGADAYAGVREDLKEFSVIADKAWDVGEFSLDLAADPLLIVDFFPAVFSKLGRGISKIDKAAALAKDVRVSTSLADLERIAISAEKFFDDAALVLRKAEEAGKTGKDLAHAQYKYAQAEAIHVQAQSSLRRAQASSGGPATDIRLRKSPIKRPTQIAKESERADVRAAAEQADNINAGKGSYIEQLAGQFERTAVNTLRKNENKPFTARVSRLGAANLETESADKLAEQLVESLIIRSENLREASIARANRANAASETGRDYYNTVIKRLHKHIKRGRVIRHNLINNATPEEVSAAYRYLDRIEQATRFDETLAMAAENRARRLEEGVSKTSPELTSSNINDIVKEPTMDDLAKDPFVPKELPRILEDPNPEQLQRRNARSSTGSAASGLGSTQTGSGLDGIPTRVKDKVLQWAQTRKRLEKEAKRLKKSGNKSELARVERRQKRIDDEIASLLTGEKILTSKGRVVPNPHADDLAISPFFLQKQQSALRALLNDPSIKGTAAEISRINFVESGSEGIFIKPDKDVLAAAQSQIARSIEELQYAQERLHLQDFAIPLAKKLIEEEVTMSRLAAAMDEPKLWPVLDQLDPDAFGFAVQRALMGAPTYEDVGDVFARIAAGADPDDVALKAGVFPEYDPMPMYGVTPDVFTHPVGPGDVLKKGEAEAYAKEFTDQLNSPYNTVDGWLPTPQLTDFERLELKAAREHFADNPDQLARLNARFSNAISLREDPVLAVAGGIDAKAERLARAAARVNAWVRRNPALAQEGMTTGTSAVRMVNMTRRFMGPFREPTRVLRDFPQLVNRLRTGQMRYDATVGANFTFLENELRKTGVLKGALRKVDENAAHRLGAILDTDPTKNPLEFQKLLSKESPEFIEGASMIRQWLNEKANQLGIKGTDDFISGYLTHLFNAEDFANPRNFPELVGIRPTAQVFLPYLLKRTGKEGYKLNAFDALDVYNRRIHAKLILEPMYADMLNMAQALPGDKKAYVNVLVDMLKGKPHGADRIFNTMGATPIVNKVSRAASTITGLFYHGLLLGRPDYVLMAYATSAATTGGRLGGLATLEGIGKMMTPRGRNLARQMGLDKTFTELFGHTGAMNTVFRTLDRVPVLGLNSVEFAIRGMSFHAALSSAMRKAGYRSFDEVINAGLRDRFLYDALRTSEDINHVFGIAGRAPILSQVFGTGATRSMMMQFHTFSVKQTEELASQLNENPGMFMRYLMYSGLIARIAADTANVDTSQYTGMAYLEQTLERAGTRVGLEGPTLQLMSDMLTLPAMIGTDNDPNMIQETGMRILQNARHLVPASLAVMDGNKAMQEFFEFRESGEAVQRNRRGEYTRPRDFGDGSVTDALGIGRNSHGELGAALLGLPSIQESLEKQAAKRATRGMQEARFKAQQTLDEYVDVIMGAAPDTERLQELVEEAAENGLILPDPKQGITSQIQARYMQRMLRQLLKDADNPEVLDAVQQYYQIIDAMERR